MQPNSKYLVSASQVNVQQGQYVEAIHADGDPVILLRDTDALESLAKDGGWKDAADMLRDAGATVEDVLNKPFIIYGSDRTDLAAFSEDSLIAVLEDEGPEDFWSQQ